MIYVYYRLHVRLLKFDYHKINANWVDFFQLKKCTGNAGLMLYNVADATFVMQPDMLYFGTL